MALALRLDFMIDARVSRFLTAAILASASIAARPALAQQKQYEVVPQATAVRGHLFLSEGPAYVFRSGTDSLGNHFRIGGEVHFGTDYRLLAGMTFLDIYSSGETSPDVGDISREGISFDFGYFPVPDKLWVKYSFLLQNVTGSQVIGSESTYGHGASIGYRFFEDGKFNVAVELSYVYMQSKTAAVVDFSHRTAGAARYPLANAASLNFRVGFDIGGK